MVTRTGHVTLIDCDEVQFTGVDGVAYACPKRSPEHAPPEISAGAGWLDPSHDLFGLTILIVQLLMEGEHPFVGVPADQNMGDVSVVKNIRLQNNRITHPERFVTSSADIPLAVLPPRIRELAVQCFGPGHRDPAARPAALTWSEELDTAAWQLMGCRFNDRHVYHNSLTTCVWCELLAAGAGERYPSAMAAAVPHSGVPAQPMPVFGPTPVATPPLPGQRQPHQPVKPATATSPTWLVVVGLIVLLFIIIAVVTHT
jgi:DNA-binding helix-hairpin-helix protein with protein kinase domain